MPPPVLSLYSSRFKSKTLPCWKAAAAKASCKPNGARMASDLEPCKCCTHPEHSCRQVHAGCRSCKLSCGLQMLIVSSDLCQQLNQRNVLHPMSMATMYGMAC